MTTSTYGQFIVQLLEHFALEILVKRSAWKVNNTCKKFYKPQIPNALTEKLLPLIDNGNSQA